VAEDLLLRPVANHGRLHRALGFHVTALPDSLGFHGPPQGLRVEGLDRDTLIAVLRMLG